MATLIQFRRDTSGNWTSNNPTLEEGELGLETDTQAYKIGDGINAWEDLPYNQLSPTLVVAVLETQENNPSVPADGYMHFYSKFVSGRSMVKMQGPSGLDTPLQPAFFQNTIWLVTPNTSTSVMAIGGAVTSVGTLSHPAVAANTYGGCTNFASGATAGNTAGTGQGLAPLCTDVGPMVNGGFFFVTRLWFPDADYGAGATGARFFVGLTSRTMAQAVGADDDSGSRIGFALSTNLAETKWKISTKDGAVESRADTGMAFAVNVLYDFYLFMIPGDDTVYFRIDDLTNETTQEGSVSARLPATSTYMRAGFQIATLANLARNVRMKKIYVETDY